MLSRLGEKKLDTLQSWTSEGYWQTELHPESRDYTAFITPSGCYRWARVPMGLKEAILLPSSNGIGHW
jgi:hypothetical protein